MASDVAIGSRERDDGVMLSHSSVARVRHKRSDATVIGALLFVAGLSWLAMWSTLGVEDEVHAHVHPNAARDAPRLAEQPPRLLSEVLLRALRLILELLVQS